MGTDVAELLMHDHSGNFGLMQSPNDIQRRPQQITCSINTDEPPQNGDYIVWDMRFYKYVSVFSLIFIYLGLLYCFR